MENDYKLKKFIGIGSRTGNYFISFNRSGIVLSSSFYRDEKIKDFIKAVLYFDDKKKALGIQFVKTEDEEGAFKLVHSNNHTTGSISARSFVFAHKLNKPEYFGRKKPKKINYQGTEIFVIDLLEAK